MAAVAGLVGGALGVMLWEHYWGGAPWGDTVAGAVISVVFMSLLGVVVVRRVDRNPAARPEDEPPRESGR